MSGFQILCATMHQKDFSKIREMNIHSDVIFANQADFTKKDALKFEGHTATMITTDTRGVGLNRNIALMYADAEICLFADDDVTYADDMEDTIVREFNAHPDADIMIFHLEADDPARKQIKYSKTRKCGPLTRMPWGGCRIAFRLSAVRKANLWFTPLFGGGCLFPSGEDSMWLHAAKKIGLTFYVSEKTIGKMSFAESTWFTGRDEKYFYGRGVYCQAVHPKAAEIWLRYYAWRMRNDSSLSWAERMKWMKHGIRGYQQMLSFEDYKTYHGL